MAVSTDYHHKQAQLLSRLADSTSDSATAKALLRLAAEHIGLAEKSVSPRLASDEE